MADNFTKFGDLLTVITNYLGKVISPKNSGTLLEPLMDGIKYHELRIELSAHIEGLEDLIRSHANSSRGTVLTWCSRFLNDLTPVAIFTPMAR